MSRPGDEEDRGPRILNEPVEMGVDEIEPRLGAPMAEEARLDMLGPERLPEKRIILKI